MAGTLQTHGGGGGIIHCALCGADAAGPCARCRKAVCGDCCVLTQASAGQWAICLDCDRRGGRNISKRWLSLGLWLLLPLLGLALLLGLLHVLFGRN